MADSRPENGTLRQQLIEKGWSHLARQYNQYRDYPVTIGADDRKLSIPLNAPKEVL